MGAVPGGVLDGWALAIHVTHGIRSDLYFLSFRFSYMACICDRVVFRLWPGVVVLQVDHGSMRVGCGLVIECVCIQSSGWVIWL